MSYVDPTSVVSPKSHLRDPSVIFDLGENDWSIANGKWKNEKTGKFDDVLLVRWNGDASKTNGHPNPRGYPTWLVVPGWAKDAIISAAEKRSIGEHNGKL